REKAKVAAQVRPQLQESSERAEADDLVLARIESIHANNRLPGFIVAISLLPISPGSKPLARAGDCRRLHRLFHRRWIGACWERAHPNDSSIPRNDCAILVIDSRAE